MLKSTSKREQFHNTGIQLNEHRQTELYKEKMDGFSDVASKQTNDDGPVCRIWFYHDEQNRTLIAPCRC
jgi:hypothetical protein